MVVPTVFLISHMHCLLFSFFAYLHTDLFESEHLCIGKKGKRITKHKNYINLFV